MIAVYDSALFVAVISLSVLSMWLITYLIFGALFPLDRPFDSLCEPNPFDGCE